jgi:hypothetical protein
MNLICQGYTLKKQNDNDYIEISIQIKTPLPKRDLPYMKTYIAELLEDTKAYCSLPSANQYFKYHYLTRSLYKNTLPLILYTGYKIYRNTTLQQNTFKHALTRHGKALFKSSLFLLPTLFCARMFLEYSSHLPLLYAKDTYKHSKDQLNAYLQFKDKINKIKYGH